MALLETLQDDFDNESLGAQWTTDTDGGGTVTEQNDRLETNCGTIRARIASATTYDLTGSHAFVRVVLPTGLATHAFMDVVDASGDGYRVIVDPWLDDAGTLWLKRLVGGSEDGDIGNVTYDPTNHRWWRLRESGGSIFLDTAPDSGTGPGTWTQRATEVIATNNPTFDKTAVTASIGSQQFVNNNAVTLWDGFNTNTTGSGGTLHTQSFAGSSTNSGNFGEFDVLIGGALSATSLNSGAWSAQKLAGPVLHTQSFAGSCLNDGAWTPQRIAGPRSHGYAGTSTSSGAWFPVKNPTAGSGMGFPMRFMQPRTE